MKMKALLPLALAAVVGWAASAGAMATTTSFAGEYAAEGIVAADLNSDHAAFVVTGREGVTSITVKVEITADDGASAATARLANDILSSIARTGGVLVVKAVVPEDYRRTARSGFFVRTGPTVKVSLTLPRGVKVVAASRHGSMKVLGVDDVRIATNHGSAVVRDADALVARSDHGSISVSDVRTAAKLRCRHGSISASRVAQVTAEADHGSASLKGVTGPLDVSCNHGSVQISVAGAVQPTRIAARFGSVSLTFPEKADAELDLVARHGSISVSGIRHRRASGVGDRLNATLGSGKVPVSVVSEHGSIRIRTG